MESCLKAGIKSESPTAFLGSVRDCAIAFVPAVSDRKAKIIKPYVSRKYCTVLIGLVCRI